MIVPFITFIRPIPVLGGSQRRDQFSAEEGWVIDVHDYGVTISRPANPEQNILETPAFCTCGVGYSVPEMKTALPPLVPHAEARELAIQQASFDVLQVGGVPAPVVTVEAADNAAQAAEHIQAGHIQATLPATNRKGRRG